MTPAPIILSKLVGIRVHRRWLHRSWALFCALACVGCAPDPPPPPPLIFAGFPVAGNWTLATSFGFKECVWQDAIDVRCRRHRVMLYGQGPYEAAVDISGSDGASGFRQLTLWSADDNDSIYNVITALSRRGWRYCYTGTEDLANQAIFTRADEPVRMVIDISYWSRRRLRIIPQWSREGLDQPCKPDTDLVRFGADVAKAAQSPAEEK